MKIYHFALAVFIFTTFSALIMESGAFSNVYSHTSTQSYTINSTDLDNIELISGQNILSGDEYAGSNPDQGGILSFIPGFSFMVNVLDKTLNIDKLIMEWVPSGGVEDIVQPFATGFAKIMQLLYGVGIITFIRKFRVE